MKFELTRKIISYVRKTPELRKPFAEYILARIYESKGIQLPVAYRHIESVLQIDERFQVLIAYLQNYDNFNTGWLNTLKGNTDDVEALVLFAKTFADEVDKENRVKEQEKILKEYIDTKKELDKERWNFWTDEKTIEGLKRKLRKLEEKYKRLMEEIKDGLQ